MSPLEEFCSNNAFVPVAVTEALAAPSTRDPLVSTGTWLPVAFCEGAYPPTVLAFTAYPEAPILCRGERFSHDTPAHELATCAATSTFRKTVSLS